MTKWVVGILVLIVLVAAAFIANFGFVKTSPSQGEKSIPVNTEQVGVTETEVTENPPPGYQGKVLAGDSPYIFDFVKSDFDQALKDDRLIVLYFYANWCPICRAEFPLMQQAFEDLSKNMENGKKIVGFRVNFNDNETNEDEKNLAREHGVAYQHTKVFIKNGQRILKSPESWDKQRYLDEINKNL